MAVMDAYNKVHKTSDNGDSVLSGIMWDSSQVTEEAAAANQLKWGSDDGGYSGYLGCELCGPDDDAAALFVGTNAATLDAWQTEFAATLNEGPAVFQGANKCHIRMFNKKADDEVNVQAAVVEVADPVLAPVEVDVHCDGVNFDDLSLNEEAFSSKAIRDSYNEVHENLDNADYQLGSVAWDHAIPTTTIMGMLGWGSDDGGYSGYLGCELCGPDDDAAFLTMGSDGVALKAWQNLLTTKLNESPFPAFQKADRCKVKMFSKPSSLADETEIKTSSPVEAPVSLKVHCDGFSYKKLSASEDVMAGKALEQSYNEVHAGIAMDDNTLSKIIFSGIVSATDETSPNLEWGSDDGGYSGYLGCELCGPDDDAAMLSQVTTTKGSTATHKAWEAAFVAKLLETTSAALSSTKKCHINMKAGTVEEEVEQLEKTPAMDMPVVLKVHCDGVSFKKLTLKQDAFTAVALEKAYNDVHAAISGDDNQLSKISFAGVVAATEEGNLRRANLKWGSDDGGYSGYLGCELCGPDDDAAMLTQSLALSKDTSSSHAAWEAALVANLVGSIKGVTKCRIHMKAGSKDAAAME